MNYHVLTISPDGRSVLVVFHIAIPDENNGAGTKLRVAMTKDTGEFISAIPDLDTDNPTEFGKLQSGELYEHSESVPLKAADTGTEKKARADARFAELSVSIVEDKRRKYALYGFKRDVA